MCLSGFSKDLGLASSYVRSFLFIFVFFFFFCFCFVFHCFLFLFFILCLFCLYCLVFVIFFVCYFECCCFECCCFECCCFDCCGGCLYAVSYDVPFPFPCMFFFANHSSTFPCCVSWYVLSFSFHVSYAASLHCYEFQLIAKVSYF